MHSTTKFLFAASLLALAACQAPPTGQEPTAAAAAPAVAVAPDDHNMTGSRIKGRTSTDRILKAMGQQEVRNAMDSAPRPLQSQ
jgi:uncharacterized lipoprotein YajG